MLTVNGLYGHVARNHMRSIWMFLGFALAYQLVGGVLLVLPIMFLDTYNLIFINPIGYFKAYGFYVLILSAAAFAFRYWRHMKSLQSELGFNYVSVMQEPRLVQIVDHLATTAGIPMPKVAILPVEAGNAFACGLNKNTATVVVTQGLLRLLDDDELEAVIAHEITHIVNGDIRSMAFANVSISSLTKLARFNPFKVEGWGKVILCVVFPPILLLAVSTGVVMSVAMTLTKVTRLLIASSREYIADAEAVRLTHKPAALISALSKIEGRSKIPALDPIADAMMIDGATMGEFATHPTIAERVKALQKHAGSMAHDVGIRKDTRAAAGLLGAKAGTFGRKLPPVPVEKIVATPRNLVDRVNSDSDKNAFGFSKSVKTKLKIAGYVFAGFMIFSSWQINNQLRNTSQKSGIHPDFGAYSSKSGKFKSIEPTLTVVKPVEQKPAKETPTNTLKLSEADEWDLR